MVIGRADVSLLIDFFVSVHELPSPGSTITSDSH